MDIMHNKTVSLLRNYIRHATQRKTTQHKLRK